MYTNREKASALEKLRRYQMQEHAMFIAYRMILLQFTLKTVGTIESNISTWAKGESESVENAAANVTGDLMKNYLPRAWLPRRRGRCTFYSAPSARKA